MQEEGKMAEHVAISTNWARTIINNPLQPGKLGNIFDQADIRPVLIGNLLQTNSFGITKLPIPKRAFY